MDLIKIKLYFILLLMVLVISCAITPTKIAEHVIDMVQKSRPELSKFLKGEPVKERNNQSIDSLYHDKTSPIWYLHIFVQNIHPKISSYCRDYVWEKVGFHPKKIFKEANLDYLNDKIPRLKKGDALSIKDELYFGKVVIVLIRPMLSPELNGKGSYDLKSLEFIFISISKDNKVDELLPFTVKDLKYSIDFSLVDKTRNFLSLTDNGDILYEIDKRDKTTKLSVTNNKNSNIYNYLFELNTKKNRVTLLYPFFKAKTRILQVKPMLNKNLEDEIIFARKSKCSYIFASLKKQLPIKIDDHSSYIHNRYSFIVWEEKNAKDFIKMLHNVSDSIVGTIYL